MMRASGWNAIGSLAIILGLAAAPHSAMATPVLEYSGSTLTGVDNVQVGSSYYDVTLESGTCATVFGACDAAHFTFTSLSDAEAAGSALMSPIETEGSPSTDTVITTIQGCSGALSVCYIYTPYGVSGSIVETAAFEDYSVEDFNDKVGAVSVNEATAVGTSSDGNIDVYAKWTLASTSTSVPEPSTITMLGVGLLALLFLRRRRKTNIEAS